MFSANEMSTLPIMAVMMPIRLLQFSVYPPPPPPPPWASFDIHDSAAYDVEAGVGVDVGIKLCIAVAGPAATGWLGGICIVIAVG